jgi:flagellar hook-length control protein FliK
LSAKIDGTGLPNFGISAANASAPSTGTAASATTNASNTVPVAGLAVAIASRAQAGSSQFDIRMDPPELGRIEVRLGVDRDGRVTSHVTVDRADTLQLLQDQQPQLQQALEQAGLKTADNGLQFSLRDQSFAGQQNNGGNGTPQNTPQLVIPDADLPTVQSAQIYNRLGTGTGVDIRV